MTPPAATQAGGRVSPRGKRAGGLGGSPRTAKTETSAGGHRGTAAKAATSAAGHRGAATKRSAPGAPRRVSGPVGGAGAAGLLGSALQIGWAPGRRSAPSSRPQRARRAAPARRIGTLPARALASVQALPDHPLLDRIIRGRTWIALLGVMLAGIVAMQVEVLKLGASVGRALQQGAALQSRNDLLRANVASLVDAQRIERLAAQMGMVMPAPGADVFLPRSGVNATRAAASIHVPDSSSFDAALAAALAAAGSTTTTASTVSGTALPTAGTTTSTSTTSTASSTGTTVPGATTATGGTAVTSSSTGPATSSSTTQSTTGPATGTTVTLPTTGTANPSGAATIGTTGG